MGVPERAQARAEGSGFLRYRFLFARYGAVTLAVKLVEAVFPPYEQVIPKDYTRLATIARKPLIEALKRAAVMCSETRGVRLEVKDSKLTLVSDDPDVGEARESLAADSRWCDEGGALTIGANARYLVEALGEIDCEHVTLAFPSADKDGFYLGPILVRGTEDAVSNPVCSARHLNVTMPMRI